MLGEIAGSREKFGGSRAQLRRVSTHLDACFGNNMEVAARLACGESDLLSRVARSRVATQEVSLIITEPGRGCRLRVVDERVARTARAWLRPGRTGDSAITPLLLFLRECSQEALRKGKTLLTSGFPIRTRPFAHLQAPAPSVVLPRRPPSSKEIAPRAQIRGRIMCARSKPCA